jgi:hypothetical protein
MNTIFSSISANYSEYQYWLSLPESAKIKWLFDIYDSLMTNKSIDLSQFFNGVYQSLQDETDPDIEMYSIPDDQDRVDVMIDDNNIMIESNSLRAVKYVIFKFVESGYIIRRDVAVEKMFKKDKVTKYLRIFKIINQAPDICCN